MDENVAASIEFRDPLIGRVLQERYRLLRMIGRGGMGVVYLAEHVLIQRKLAIKLLHSQLTASEELVQRFHREARAAAAVGNEHIIDVTDMGRLDDGTYYIALEYLDGPDLAALVEANHPLPIERVLDIGMQVCEALAEVHAAGIVHRDLKPENIVLIRRSHEDDFVKILDFGICKVWSERSLTATGVALGTPQFMPPEQVEARPELDARADVYAVGAILFFALTGRAPFVFESLPHLLLSIWRDPAPRLRSLRPDAPEALEVLIARALEKHPDHRFCDARALGSALAAVAASFGVTPRGKPRPWASVSGVRETAAQVPLTAESSGIRRGARRRTRWLAASLAILSLALVAGWLYGAAETGPAGESRPRAGAPAPTTARPIAAAAPETRALVEMLEVPSDPATETLEPHPPPAAQAPVRVVVPRRKKVVATLSETPLESAPASTTAAEPPPITPAVEMREPKALSTEEPTAPPTPPIVPKPAELRRVF